MFWRYTHDTLKWLWPAAFGGLLACVTVAIGASTIWPGAKTWTEAVFLGAVAVANNPIFWAATLAVFIVWLAAFIWSGHKVAQTVPQGTPPGTQVSTNVAWRPPSRRAPRRF